MDEAGNEPSEAGIGDYEGLKAAQGGHEHAQRALEAVEGLDQAYRDAREATKPQVDAFQQRDQARTIEARNRAVDRIERERFPVLEESQVRIIEASFMPYVDPENGVHPVQVVPVNPDAQTKVGDGQHTWLELPDIGPAMQSRIQFTAVDPEIRWPSWASGMHAGPYDATGDAIPREYRGTHAHRCAQCGCSEYEPCDPPCSWVGPDLCSQCLIHGHA